VRGTHQCLHVAAVVKILPPLLQERPYLGLTPLHEIGANLRRNRSKGVTLRKAKRGSNKGERYDTAVQQQAQCAGSVESLITQRQQAARCRQPTVMASYSSSAVCSRACQTLGPSFSLQERNREREAKKHTDITMVATKTPQRQLNGSRPAAVVAAAAALAAAAAVDPPAGVLLELPALQLKPLHRRVVWELALAAHGGEARGGRLR
jgi:hypothetical protein